MILWKILVVTSFKNEDEAIRHEDDSMEDLSSDNNNDNDIVDEI